MAIDGRGLLIRGASGAGKSTLALALIALAAPGRPIELVGDDRVLLHPRPGGVVARPHPRIAGFIERRGLGLVAIPWRERAVLAACLEIGAVACAGEAEVWLRDLPTLRLDPRCGGAGSREAAARVLAWWREPAPPAADRSQVVRKRRGLRPSRDKEQLVSSKRST